MSFAAILQNIRRYTSLTPQEESEFCALLHTRKVRRKEFLLREGSVCNFESYVNKGCFRTYYVDKKGLEHNLYFAIEDWWISDLYSRTSQEPSNCNIIALEDSEIVVISHSDLETFLTRTPALERFFRISYQQSLVHQHLKNLRMLHMSGEELYIHFREKYPDLARRIPQKHVATFLGLTPEFFNTIHAKVLRLK